MSRLTEIIDEIRDSEQGVSRMEQLVALYPDRASVRISLETHLNYTARLKQELRGLSDRYTVDVCGYRLFTDDNKGFTIPALSNALLKFQSLYTLVYDAIVTNTPKARGQVSIVNTMNSTFDYGYSFAGSVGFMMTLPNERLLIGGSQLDEAMDTTFSLLKSQSSDQISQLSGRLGPAVIRAAYKWAESLGESGLGADINWRRGDEVRANLLIQLPEIRNLQRAIQETSDSSVETVVLWGTLKGADTRKGGERTFHLAASVGENTSDIRGLMAETIGIVKVPTDGKATVEITTQTNYATELEDRSYLLRSWNESEAGQSPSSLSEKGTSAVSLPSALPEEDQESEVLAGSQ